mgnify:CR=1 FL=1
MEDKHTAENGGTYATGVTQPCKSRNVLSIFLILATFRKGELPDPVHQDDLSAVVIRTGFESWPLNSDGGRLKLSADGLDEVAPVSFEVPIVDGGDLYPNARLEAGIQIRQLGIWYMYISNVNNWYYDIPVGPLVTSVTEETKAAGVCTGDILCKVKGQPVGTTQQLQTVLEGCENEEQLTVTIYRPSIEKEMEVTLPVQK